MNKLSDKIEANNKAFKKLSKAAKRVFIAQDALSRINSGQYRPERGVWALIPSISDHTDIDKSVQKMLVEDEVKCQCCALGSLLLSCTVANNNVSVGDYYNYYVLDYSDIKNEYAEDKAKILEIFPEEQLALIEITFEEGTGYYSEANDSIDIISPSELDKCFKFGRKYPDKKDRLVAILKNIIKNKGTFKP